MSTELAVDPEHGRALLRRMILIRRFEEKSAELYTQGKIRGFLHLYVGEEAVAVGTSVALEPGDAVVATYREHGQAIMRGVPPGAVMAEMFGKATGCSRGRGGSMHLFDAERRFYGGNAIVAGGLPLAVGLALADEMQGIARVTACYFGEGAAAEGAFHESLNLAALWHVPVLFLCENNLYAMGTAIWRSQSRIDVADKALAYGIPAHVVDGMDVLAVEQATREAAGAVRSGAGGVEAEVVDLRTLRPLDTATVVDSVRRTRRAVVVDEGWRTGSFAAEVSAQVVESAFYDLDGPVARVCAAEVPIPYAKHLEDAALPQPETIERAALDLVRFGG